MSSFFLSAMGKVYLTQNGRLGLPPFHLNSTDSPSQNLDTIQRFVMHCTTPAPPIFTAPPPPAPPPTLLLLPR